MRISALCVLAGVGGAVAVAHVERQVTGLPLPSPSIPSVTTSSISSTTSGTDPSSTATQPNLSFSKPVSMIACTTGSISWDYSGPDITIKLTAEVATNVAPTPGALGERQLPALPPFRIGLAGAGANVAKRQVVGTTTTLGSGIKAQSQQFQWNPVNVPAGTYILVAASEDPAFATQSSSDRFQIVNGTNVACLSQSSSTSSASSTPTSSSGSSATAVPVSTAGRANAGAIAGGVIGGLVLLIGLAAALFLFYRRAQSPTRPRDAWGALKSDPAHGGTGGASRYGAQDLGPGPSVGGVASDESLPNEKVFAHPYAAPAAAALPYAAGVAGERPRSHKRNSTQSSLHYTTREHPDVNPFAAPGAVVHPPTSGSASPVYGLPTPTPTSAGFPSSAGASAGHSSGSASGEMIPMQRSPSTGNGTGTARRTARKPVPNYVPQDAAPSPSPTPSSTSHLPPGDVPELTHKSSFGPGSEGRPVHYLIPDMPADE